MPAEYALLAHEPIPIDRCPKCGERPFYPFLRGQVQSWWRKLLRRPYCCLICSGCKEMIGYEAP